VEWRLSGTILLLVVLSACSREPAAIPIGEPIEIPAPLGLPAVPYPPDNPPTAETVALGKRLFFDPALSADGSVSCATCHEPKLAFADGKPLAVGIGGQKAARNSPTVLNAVYYESQFHDGRAATLEEQVEGPLTNPVEMGNIVTAAVATVAADPTYPAEFERAFGPGPVTFEKIGKAIAAYERTLVSGDSAFDRFRFGKDETALTESAKRGWEIFRDPERGNCTICHLVGAHSAPFTDHLFHNLGVGSDLGRYIVTSNDADRGAFKTPTLRNVALTAPYMHDGSLATLFDVIDLYAMGGRPNPHLDPELKPIALTAQDRTDLIAFLESLTSPTATTAE
jgi:cytochrome c peroxidase